MTPPAVCEACGQPLVVDSGDEGTSCYWCPRCKAPRDPAGAVSVPVAPARRPILRLPSGRGTNRTGRTPGG